MDFPWSIPSPRLPSPPACGSSSRPVMLSHLSNDLTLACPIIPSSPPLPPNRPIATPPPPLLTICSSLPVNARFLQLLFLALTSCLSLRSPDPHHSWMLQGAHCKGKQGKWSTKIWKFCRNSGNFICSSCKFPDSKDSG